MHNLDYIQHTVIFYQKELQASPSYLLGILVRQNVHGYYLTLATTIVRYIHTHSSF